MRHLPAMILASGLVAFGAGSVRAQAVDDPLPSVGDCEAAPVPEAVPGTPGTSGDDTLSDVLGPCDGVLAPPPVGDEDLTVAPPPAGRTPVIGPEEVPPQPGEGE